MNCTYCKREMHTRQLSFNGLRKTRDHYIPISRGGRNEKENIRFACLRCNNVKGNMMPEQWEAFMANTPLWWVNDAPTRRRTKATKAELARMTAEENSRRYRNWAGWASGNL